MRVRIAASQRHGADPEDLAVFRPQRHLSGDTTVTLLPYGGGEQVCLGKALAKLEGDQDLTLRVIPSRTGASDWNQTAVQTAAMDR